MSEELQARGLLRKGQIVARFEYLSIGRTNLNQLKQAKYIPDKDYGQYGTRMPDRLLIERKNKKNSVIVVVEDKKEGKFQSKKEVKNALQQCNDVCQEVKAKIGVVTDDSLYVWFNPNQLDEANNYRDETTNKLRSYTIITNISGTTFNQPFIIDTPEDQANINKLTDKTRQTIKTVIDVVDILSTTNSVIKPPPSIDPLPLAKSVWQAIWVATGKSPEKCLYNVVELLIFKFLSDLEVLKGPYSFDALFNLYASSSNNEVLSYYANICRPKITELFPKGKDGTTIINGTIFVENNKPVLQMSSLFRTSLKMFKDFGDKVGNLKNIDKDFKTKLYESFLKQSEGLKTLGQYFTPRKVVRAIVQMSGVDRLRAGQKMCDPFCGVGGFVLEPINLYKSLHDNFLPVANAIEPAVQFRGYDKGFEKDEERTIILAKANMLIYLADIVSQYNTLTNEFADTFNDVFKLLQNSNLGTLGEILEEDQKYDLIMTNPPYVTSGIRTLKNEILADAALRDFYRINAGGVEGLALEWIIRSLKHGGSAFVIIPDGLLNRLNDKKIRKFLLEECFLDAIISLPARTFFTTPKKTYILAITKKYSSDDVQSEPVFTYLVTHIGETLDVNRFDIPENDLEEMVSLFNQFKGAKSSFRSPSTRGKVQPIAMFDPQKHWSVDRWWTREERINLGIEDEEKKLSQEEFREAVVTSWQSLETVVNEANNLLKNEAQTIKFTNFKEVNLGDESCFKLNIGKRVVKKYLHENRNSPTARIPLYSANVFHPFGYLEKSNLASFDHPYIIWGIDGDFDFDYKPAGQIFATTDHCGSIEILDENIDPEYLLYQLDLKKFEYGFDRGLRASTENVKTIAVEVPVLEDGSFDREGQQVVLAKHKAVAKLQGQLKELAKGLALASDSRVAPE